MEKDFHHHIIYALAKIAGFDKKIQGSDETEAQIIAYSSQYVDDNCDRTYTINKDNNKYPLVLQDRIKTTTGRYYYPVLTQSVNIKSLDINTQRYIFMPFHFLPGNYEPVEIKGKKNPYCTTKDSTNANKLVKDALRSGDFYRIGIALHTYADSWSHQRFTAFNEPWNKVIDWYKDFKALAPDIGHADVWHLPDQICKTWRDHRFDEDSLVNKDRVFEAIEKIYEYLYHERKGTPWADVKNVIEKLVYLNPIDDSDEKKIYDERVKHVEKLTGEPLNYNSDKWFEDVIEFDLSESKEYSTFDSSEIHEEKVVPVNIRLKDNFRHSHWYKFQTAAKIQLSHALELTANL